MTASLIPPSVSLSPEQEANFEGERVTHLFPNDCYYAHLSIYHFASHFLNHGRVLDAGCGAGYGAAYLAKHGAQVVHGIEVSAEAVAFSQKHFHQPNLQYQIMDLQHIAGFDAHSFDLIYSSNVLEHVPDVRPFFRSASLLLRNDGTLVIAVPPVTNWELQAHNLANPFHCNIWSPRQWYAMLHQYFETIQCYRHMWDKPDVTLDFANSPADTIITERDFVFHPATVDDLMYQPTLTAVFVARKPRPASDLPDEHAPLPVVDNSYTLPFDQPETRRTVAQRLVERTHAVQQVLAPILDPTAAGQADKSAQAVFEAERDTLLHTIHDLKAQLAVQEQQLMQKNSHITHLEGLIARIESGRVLRLLRALSQFYR